MHVTSCMEKTHEIFANMPLTLTGEARVLNSKASGPQGCSPVGGWLKKKISRLDKFMNNIFLQILVQNQP